jgi:hypothetical protein
MPMFQLCVKTNVDYPVVAVFVTQYEDSGTLIDPLKFLSEWNTQWKPNYFMTDFAECEIKAVESADGD